MKTHQKKKYQEMSKKTQLDSKESLPLQVQLISTKTVSIQSLRVRKSRLNQTKLKTFRQYILSKKLLQSILNGKLNQIPRPIILSSP